MEALTIHPKNKEQLRAIKSVLKAMKIPFEKKESPYDPAFVKMVHDAEEERDGAITLTSSEDIDEYFNRLENEVQG